MTNLRKDSRKSEQAVTATCGCFPIKSKENLETRLFARAFLLDIWNALFVETAGKTGKISQDADFLHRLWENSDMGGESLRVIVVGAEGKMGKEVRRLLTAAGHLTVAAVDRSYSEAKGNCYPALSSVTQTGDVAVDFSHHDNTKALLDFALARRIPLVIAATGQNAEQIRLIHRAAAHIPIFFSANLSIGAAFLADTVRRAARLFPEAEFEIVETHHGEKSDAPSGTAMMLLSAIGEARECTAVCGRYGHRRREKREVGVHSIRIGNSAGEHTVMLSAGEEMLILTHRAESRTLFARGAVVAMEFLIGKEAGLYGMSALLAEREGKC